MIANSIDSHCVCRCRCLCFCCAFLSFFFAVNFIGILFNAFVGSQQGGEKKALNQHQHFGYQSKQKKIYRKNKPKKTYTHQHTQQTHIKTETFIHTYENSLIFFFLCINFHLFAVLIYIYISFFPSFLS